MLQLAARPVWYTGQQGQILYRHHAQVTTVYIVVSCCFLTGDLLVTLGKQKGAFHREGNVLRLAHICMMMLLNHSFSK